MINKSNYKGLFTVWAHVYEISRIGKFIEDYKDMEVSGCSVSFRGHVNILETDSGN